MSCLDVEEPGLDSSARGVLEEDDLAALGVGHDCVAVLELALQELERQRVLDQPLDGAPERPRAVDGVVALTREQILGRRRQRQRDALVGQARRCSGGRARPPRRAPRP
jgi:hypothetical protein